MKAMRKQKSKQKGQRGWTGEVWRQHRPAEKGGDLNPSQRKVIFKEASYRVVCSSEQISWHEMGKKNMPGTCEGPKGRTRTTRCKDGRARNGEESISPNAEALVWCKKCSGCARCRLEPKPMKHCRPEKMGTWEDEKKKKRILILEEGRVPDRNARGWKVEGEKEESPGMNAKRLREKF